MSRKRSNAGVRGKTVKRPRSREATVPELLVLECNAPHLARQGVRVAEQVVAFFKQLLVVRVHFVRTEGTQVLLNELRELSDQKARPRLVIVVGHSSQRGIRLTSDRFADWSQFATWLVLLRPEQLLLVGCEAGSWLPCRALFKGVPSLQVILGSPLKLNAHQAAPIVFAIQMLLNLPQETVEITQLINWAQTRGVMIRRTRDEYLAEKGDNGIAWQLMETGMKILAGQRQ